MPRAWYSYLGGSQLLPASYRLIKGKPACLNGTVPCAIYVYYPGSTAPSTPIGPLSSNIQTYIATAIATLVAEPQNDGKKYVYVRFNS